MEKLPDFVQKSCSSGHAQAAGKHRHGMTMVEIIVVVGIAVLMIGGLVMLLTNFRRGYQSGEEAAVSLQDAAMFVATLRRDLINAVLPANLPADQWGNALTATDNQLSMTVFVDANGNTERVTYEYLQSGDSNSIVRRVGGGGATTIAREGVASLTWKVHCQALTGKAAGLRQVWIELSALFQKPRKLGGKSKSIQIDTRLFPVRLNKQLH